MQKHDTLFYAIIKLNLYIKMNVYMIVRVLIDVLYKQRPQND